MKRTMIITGLAIVLAGSVCYLPHRLLAQTNAPSADRKILYYTCPMHPSVKADKPGNCPICGMNLEPVYGDSNATTNAPSPGTNNATATDNKPVPYPFSTCIVDGMKLNSMGGPYVFVYQGQEIKMCCANCKPTFLQNADQYMKKIRDGEARE